MAQPWGVSNQWNGTMSDTYVDLSTWSPVQVMISSNNPLPYNM